MSDHRRRLSLLVAAGRWTGRSPQADRPTDPASTQADDRTNCPDHPGCPALPAATTHNPCTAPATAATQAHHQHTAPRTPRQDPEPTAPSTNRPQQYDATTPQER